MTGKISVSGDVHLEGFEVLDAGARGADAVVVGPGGDAIAAARLAPAAALLLADAPADEVARVLAATLWPRPRVVGVRGDDLGDAVRAVLGRGEIRLRVTLADGERDVVLGRCGVRSLVDAASSAR
jgi:hypothetical protein